MTTGSLKTLTYLLTYLLTLHSSGRCVQWKEASFTDKRGDVFRVYTVCNVDAKVVNNWLRLPFILVSSDVDHSGADDPVRLYVELRFTMRRCTGYPEPGRLQRCRESFKLLAYDATSDVGNARRPTWDDRTYRTIGVVAADRVFADTVDTSAVNTEVRGLQVSHQCSNYRRDGGIPHTAVVNPHVIHGVKVSALVLRCRPPTAFSSTTVSH